MADGEGFEPPEAFTSTVFKTAAIGHSATHPWKFIPKRNVSLRRISASSTNGGCGVRFGWGLPVGRGCG